MGSILYMEEERSTGTRDGVELGLADYPQRPVPQDRLAQALRHVADSIERKGALEREDYERRRREEAMKSFVEAAFLHGIMLGEPFGADLDSYREVLGIPEPFALVAAAAFQPALGPALPEEELRLMHGRFKVTVRNRFRAFLGPLVAGHTLVLLPLPDAASAEGVPAALRSVLVEARISDAGKGSPRLGFGSARPLAEAAASWSEAMGDLLGGRGLGAKGGPEEHAFEHDDAFLEGLKDGSPERARLCLERLVEPLRTLPSLPVAERYRIITLFGAACRLLARRGLLDREDASTMMDLEDLRAAGNGPAFDLVVRARFAMLAGVLGRGPALSPLVSRAIAFVRENYGKPMNLESTAYALGISPSRLSRLFSEETGKGFTSYLSEFRIEKAKALLVRPGTRIKQVSLACGYADPNYFSRLFRKVTGMQPTTFIDRARTGIS